MAVSAGLSAVAGLVAWLLGADLARELRKVYAWLGPTHVVELGIGAVIVCALVSLPPTDALLAPAVGPLRRAAARAGAAITAIPRAITLTALVASGAAVHISLGLRSTVPTVLGDELLYVNLAKSIAVHGEPLMRGQLDIGKSVLYPLFLSPAYAVASDGAAAFAAARVMNAIAMALTAVPAYLLARRVLTSGWSLVVAASAVLAPWLAYSAFTLTEPLFYPVFTTFALVLVLVLEQPTVRRQLTLLCLLAVLVGIRPQALAVAASVVLAILAKGVLEHALVATCRRYLFTFALLAGALAVALGAAAAGVQVPTSGYSSLFSVHYAVEGVAKWTLWNVGTYLFSVGVVGVAAFPLALARLLGRNATAQERAFGVASASLVLGLLASVAALSASPFGLGILHERNLFYATPLLIACLAYWLVQGRPRPVRLATVVVVATVGCAASVPAGILERTNNVDSPTAAFLRGLHGVAPSLPERLWLVLVAGAGLAVLVTARRTLGVVAAVVLAFAAVAVTADFRAPLTGTQDRALAWVDRALPAGATATIVHVDLTRPNLPCAETAEYEQQGLLVWTEYFNTRVDRLVHVYGSRGRDFLSAPLLTVGAGGVVLDGTTPVRPAFVVIDSRQPVVGTRIHRFDLTGIDSPYQDGSSLTLWRVSEPLRLLPAPNPLPPRADGRSC